MTIPRALLPSALLAVIFSSTLALAQKPSTAPDYTRESSVIERLDRVYTYAADGTGSREIIGLIAIHDQAGVKAWSVLPIPFASSAEHVVIDYVRVRRADGTLLETPAADAQELPAAVTREAPFYSDLKEDQIPVRSLREGDHLEYKFHIIRTKPEAPNHFWGAERFYTVSSATVVLSESIELHLPASVYVQTYSPTLKPTLADTPTEHVFRWQTSQPIPVAGKTHNELLRLEKDPALRDETVPRLPTVAWTNFHTWAEVGAWYRSMEGSRTDPDDDIRAKVKELTAGKSTDEEKARAIYAFVSNQVRYIGVAFGIGRYQPHQASEVLSNQYGDCKDKTTLLISMLAAANIPADAVLIGANVAFIPELPSPGAFNHAINLAHVDGQPVWLDATAEVAPYRLLNYVIRDRKALVIPLSGEAHIETTPKDPPFPSTITFTATGSLDDKGTSHSKIVWELRGDTELIFRAAVRSVSPAQWDELMKGISQAMSYSGTVTNTQFSRPDDTAAPFRATYDYEREKAGDWEHLRTVPQLMPLGLADVDEKDPPVSPIQLGPPQLVLSHAAMTLPPGWSAELPAAIHAKSAFATLDKTYKFEHGVLTTDLRYQGLAEKVPAADWKAYHQWYKDAGLDGETFIQLRGTSSGAAASTSPDTTINDPKAGALILEAIALLQKNDAAGAKSKLDQAKAINPHQMNLWSGYASVAMLKKDTAETNKDLTRELKEHPENPMNFNFVRYAANNELQFGHRDDAIALLQTQVSISPDNTDAVLYLAAILNKPGELPAAEKVLRAGLLASPDNANLKMRLGINLVQQHKPDEGEPILRDTVTTSEDPGQLNDAAYELANASLDLPLAEKAARHSLDLLDALSINGETGPAALQRANLLCSVWDTYGWILYREDKIAEAEPWIRASWRNGNSAEVGYHLGMILDRQHHPTDALAQLQLAAAGNPGSNAAEVQKLIDTKVAELQKSTNTPAPPATKGNVITAPGMPPRNFGISPLKLRLQNDRTYTFPRTMKTKVDDFATIELDVTNKGTTAVRYVDGDQTLEALFDAVRKIDLHLDIPPDSKASLLRRAILNCSTEPTCQLVLIDPQSAH
jgi:transglutaminase-like putative cysteine protease/Tfp pilus assembly protein PilF